MKRTNQHLILIESEDKIMKRNKEHEMRVNNFGDKKYLGWGNGSGTRVVPKVLYIISKICGKEN